MRCNGVDVSDSIRFDSIHSFIPVFICGFRAFVFALQVILIFSSVS